MTKISFTWNYYHLSAHHWAWQTLWAFNISTNKDVTYKCISPVFVSCMNLLNNKYCLFGDIFFNHCEPRERRMIIYYILCVYLLLYSIFVCIAKSHIQQMMPLRAQPIRELPSGLLPAEPEPEVKSSVSFSTVVYNPFRPEVIPPLPYTNRRVFPAGKKSRGSWKWKLNRNKQMVLGLVIVIRLSRRDNVAL